ncbi:hypothetical protein [Echinicola shivajiensis]|nr:hypothetical protein [Echinicola shivajiensis]
MRYEVGRQKWEVGMENVKWGIGECLKGSLVYCLGLRALLRWNSRVMR